MEHDNIAVIYTARDLKEFIKNIPDETGVKIFDGYNYFPPTMGIENNQYLMKMSTYPVLVIRK